MTNEKIKAIKISDIAIDGGTQQRERINDEAIFDYSESMKCGAKFPPVTVFFDGVKYWLADGFHRFHASRAAGFLDLQAVIRDGTKRDAKLFSASANGTHGLRLTNADKRRSVLVLLEDKEWSQWSDRDIAKHCNVTHPFVSKLRQTTKKSAISPQKNDKKNKNIADEVVTVTTHNASSVIESQSPSRGDAAVNAAHPNGQDDDLIDGLNLLVEDLYRQIDDLKNQLASGGNADYKSRLDELTAEIKTLAAKNKNLTRTRDALMNEKAAMQNQLAALSRKLKKLEQK